MPTYGSHSPVISGDGRTIAFLSSSPFGDGFVSMTGDGIFITSTMGSDDVRFVFDNASDLSVDATGGAFTFVSGGVCDFLPTVVAFQRTRSGGIYATAVGTVNTDRRSGFVADPVISADGSTVAWTTTVPEYDFGGGTIPAPALPVPVVRLQEVSWWDAAGGGDLECSGVLFSEWIDAAEGSQATLSASGRTLALATTDQLRIDAIDRHTNEGIAVTSVQPTLAGTGFMTEVPISSIPASSLTDYAPQLAGAPIYRLPIYRLPIYRLPIYRLPIYRLLVDDSPIYRLPIYRLPIYRLPIYRLDLPGGWDQALVGSPFENELVQSVTLDEVLAWADRTLADGSGATDAELASARVIQSLTLQDLDLDSSGLSGLSLASYVLGDAPVAEIPAGAGLPHWQKLVEEQGLDLTVDAETVLAELDSAGLDIARTDLDHVALRELPVERTLFGDIDMTSLYLPGTPLGGVDLSTLSGETLVALFGTSNVSGSLAEPTIPLTSGTVADLALGAPATSRSGCCSSRCWTRRTTRGSRSPPSRSIRASPPRARRVRASCGENVRCNYAAPYRFTFDAGPGEPTDFAAPTASVTLPQGTVLSQLFLTGLGPEDRSG